MSMTSHLLFLEMVLLGSLWLIQESLWCRYDTRTLSSLRCLALLVFLSTDVQGLRTQQISELKQGAEIVVCTRGRMIDVLCTSNGKIINLRRVTFLVMDEVDRMFDMGFEPQITRLVQNTRLDRQTILSQSLFHGR